MEAQSMIISFIVLMLVICGVIIFLIKRMLIADTEGAVARLNEETAKITARQNELSKKIKEADEELQKKQMETKQLSEQMRNDAAEESKAEREKIINEARKEGEEIIAKAQGAKEKMRQELEKEVEIKSIKHGMTILKDVLSQRVRGSFEEIIIDEFLESLKSTDMSRISPDIKTVEVITLKPINVNIKNRLNEIFKEKLRREITVQASTEADIGGGVIVKFGSMTLDGSIKNLIREKGTVLQEIVENG